LIPILLNLAGRAAIRPRIARQAGKRPLSTQGVEAQNRTKEKMKKTKNQTEIDKIQTQWLLLEAAANCLHVGCGEKYIAGAVNLDPNPDRAAWRDLV